MKWYNVEYGKLWYPFAAKVDTSRCLRTVGPGPPIPNRSKMDQDTTFINSVARSGIVLRLKLISNKNENDKTHLPSKIQKDQSNTKFKVFEGLKYWKY